jgi:DNA-binding MarR family transcriptional regulator
VEYQEQQDSIAFLLGSICRAKRALVGDAMAKVGLYAGQEQLLWSLWQEDGLAQSQLVDRICVQPPTVSKMLDRMEKSGLVTRRPDPEDSRCTRVYLTDEGRALEKSVRSLWLGLEDRLTENLTPEERAQLHDLLTRVRQSLDAVQSAERP